MLYSLANYNFHIVYRQLSYMQIMVLIHVDMVLFELGFLNTISFPSSIALTQSGTILLGEKSPPPITLPALQVETGI